MPRGVEHVSPAAQVPPRVSWLLRKEHGGNDRETHRIFQAQVNHQRADSAEAGQAHAPNAKGASPSCPPSPPPRCWSPRSTDAPRPAFPAGGRVAGQEVGEVIAAPREMGEAPRSADYRLRLLG